MQPLRQLRKSLTISGLRLGMEFARRSEGPALIETIRHVARLLTRTMIPLRMRLATNMKLTGVYRPGLIDEYFERAIDQMIMLAHILRAGPIDGGCRERFVFDGSVRILEQAYGLGKGVINISPHICGYPMYPGIVSQRVPCSIYIRRNKDPRKMHITETLARTHGADLIYPPIGATRNERLQIAVNVLREGKMLFVTPDVFRKPDEGVPVTLLGRTTHFPTGAFVMAMRTGAPIVPVVWHWQDGAYHIRYSHPLELTRTGRIKEQTERALQTWVQSVDAFLHEHPDMWWNWLDNRWTWIVRGTR